MSPSSYTVIPSIDGAWGSMNPNGSFNGMIGMLERDEIDIALTSFYVTEARAKACDFTTGVMDSP